ncbi:MAG: DUF2283 domain-containing protein [Thermodesulfobacteriota bacterium]
MMPKQIYFTFVWMTEKQRVVNKRVSDDVVLDIGEDERIVGIEILDASKHLNLEKLLPVKYEVLSEGV